MKKFTFAAGLLAGAALMSCSRSSAPDTQTGTAATTATPANDPKNLASVFDAYWEENAKLFPLDATAQGDNRYNDQLPNDQTAAFRQQLRQFYQKYLEQLRQHDRAQLSENDRISYDIFQYDLQTKLEGLQLNTWMMPFQQFWGLPLTMGHEFAGTVVVKVSP